MSLKQIVGQKTYSVWIEMLQQLASEKLDVDCVNALIENRKEVEKIQQHFKEDIYG